MKIDLLPIGQYEENTYVVHEDGLVFIVDPGRHAKEIKKYIKDEKVIGIFLTHGHDDHTGAVDDLVDDYGCPVYLHPLDFSLVQLKGNAHNGGSTHPLTCPLLPLEEGELTLEDLSFKVIHTPGHTSGSVLIQYQKALFTGDTLFQGTIGRTDLFSGDWAEMRKSLEIIAHLDSDLRVLPGHGMTSTIAIEKQTNPFLKEFL